MPFLTLNGATVRVRSNAAPEKYNEHGLDRERMFDGAMRQTLRGRYRQWDLTAQLTVSDSRTLIALLTTTDIPLLAAGDLINNGISEECSVIPILVSNDPIQTGGGFRRQVVFTLHETPAPLPADTTASPYVFLRRAFAMFSDDDAETPATAEDDPVALWQDQSGNDRHATQTHPAGPDLRPTLTAAGLLQFGLGEAPRTSLLIPGPTGGSAGELLISVAAGSDPGPGTSGSSLYSIGADATLYSSSDGHVYDGFGVGSAALDIGNLTTDLTELNVFNPSSHVANGYVARMNNAVIYTQPVSGYTFGFGGAWLLGEVSGGGYFVGTVREIVLFDAILTTSQRRSWFEYMSGLVDDPPLAE